MKLTKTILYVGNITQEIELDIFEALQIIDAASETFVICGKSAEYILKLKVIQDRLQNETAEYNHRSISGLDIFDNFELDENLLIVTIGDQAHLKVYVTKRISRSKGQYAWHIINSTYARIGYLERQKSISDFIPSDTVRWLKNQIDKFGEKVFHECLKFLEDSRVLILGETIIDEYIYCEALGKVTKDPILAFEKRSKHVHLGGVLAVARHFSGLGVTTNVITKWASSDDDLVMAELKSNNRINLFNLSSDTSIKKTRYVDKSSNTRVFESYELPAESSSLATPLEITNVVRDNKIVFDHLVIMDYGHYFFDHEKTTEYRNFGVPVSVNTQSNAGNRGFNPVSNYMNANKVFLNGSEVQVEMRNRISHIETIIMDLGRRLNCEELFVTNGSAGIISWRKDKGILISPTFAPTIIDRTGAGDALLAVVSSLRMNNVPIEIATFFGNLAGSLLVGVMGNERIITSTDLQVESDRIIHKVRNL
jgi:sugar/nucleoside kinase (ribokinase family)